MQKPIIRLVDDDEALADSFELLLKTMGWDVAKYASGKTFLAEDDLSAPGCIVLDVRMPDMTGLEVQLELEKRGVKLPILFLSAHGNIAMAVHAVRHGATDFLEKPVDPDQLAPAVEKALQLARRKDWKLQLKELVEVLSHRERQIFEFVSQGLKNNEIAEKLFLSQRTVEVHRAHITRKIGQAAPTRILYELSLANDDGIFPIPPKKRAKED